ncbi:MAG: hypothetical protein ABIH23_09880 [bacterium]
MVSENHLEYIPHAFGLDLFYPPLGLADKSMREIYLDLADRCRFTEFRQLGEGQGARLAEGMNRHLTILHDRLTYRDEFTQSTFPGFQEDMLSLLPVVRTKLSMPVWLHCKVLIRLLLPYQAGGTAVEFLANRCLTPVVGNLNTFSRPTSGLGIRLVFPSTTEKHSTFHLRIEPYFRDLKMFFLENRAQFYDPVVDVEQLRPFLVEAYEFIKNEAGPFILACGSS